MRVIDRDGLILCEIQAKVFEQSIEREECSSSIFTRRYMNSKICAKMDKLYFLNEAYSMGQIFDEVNEEYGVSTYGKTKFSKNEMYWMGYIYRYFAYIYDWDSSRIYKTINATELRKLYFAYHTLDPKQAIDRILEAKGIKAEETEEEIIKRGVEILRRLRNNK